jgi:hypothetical protein
VSAYHRAPSQSGPAIPARSITTRSRTGSPAVGRTNPVPRAAKRSGTRRTAVSPSRFSTRRAESSLGRSSWSRRMSARTARSSGSSPQGLALLDLALAPARRAANCDRASVGERPPAVDAIALALAKTPALIHLLDQVFVRLAPVPRCVDRTLPAPGTTAAFVPAVSTERLKWQPAFAMRAMLVRGRRDHRHLPA